MNKMFVDLCVGFEVRTEFKTYVLKLMNQTFSNISKNDLLLLLDTAKLMLEQVFFISVGGACIDFLQLDSVEYAQKLISREAAKTALKHVDNSFAAILPLVLHSKEKHQLILQLIKTVSKYHPEEDLFQWCGAHEESNKNGREEMWNGSSHVLEKTPKFLLDFFNSHVAILSLFHSSSIIFMRIFALLPFNTIMQLAISFFICNGILRRKNRRNTLGENSTYIHEVSENFKAAKSHSHIPTGQFRLELEQFLRRSKNLFSVKGFPSSFK